MHSELAVQIIPQMYPEPTRVQIQIPIHNIIECFIEVFYYNALPPCMHICMCTQIHTQRQRHTVHMCLQLQEYLVRVHAVCMDAHIRTDRQTHTCRVWWISLGKFFNVQIGICLSGGSCVDE